MIQWSRRRVQPLTARPATAGDRDAVVGLLARAERRFGRQALEEQVHLLHSGLSALAVAGESPVGFLGIRMRTQPGPERWAELTMAALEMDVSPAAALAQMLDSIESRLRQQNPDGVICLSEAGWLNSGLSMAGFVETDQVITYLRTVRRPLRTDGPARLEVATAAHAGTVLDINAAAFAPIWRYDSATVLAWLFTADHARLAWWKGQPVGFALTTQATGGGYAQLVRVAVRPDAQRLGIGRQLVTDAVAYAESSRAPGLALNTQASNNVSRHLYESLGFRLSGPPIIVMIRPVGKTDV